MKVSRLKTLSMIQAAYADAGVRDQWELLPPKIQAGWKRVLSSIATTEGYEAIVLKPIVQAFDDQDAKDYLRSHATDEERHSAWLNTYLSGNFSYKKRKPTVSDRIFYHRLIPWASANFVRFPRAGIVSLYAYERFAMRLYDTLIADADKRGLAGLGAVLRAIVKDEGKHVVGLGALLRHQAGQNRTSKIVESAFARMCLTIVRMDLRFGLFGPHNRELTSHFAYLGITAKTVDNFAKLAVAEAFGLLSQMPRDKNNSLPTAAYQQKFQ